MAHFSHQRSHLVVFPDISDFLASIPLDFLSHILYDARLIGWIYE